MKTNFWKRAAALLLALVLCFACVGTASAAEDVSGKVYLLSYPRDGDENYHTGSWSHDALYFRHGWKLSASDYLDVRAIGSYDANICYCIEPGVIQNTGDAFSRSGCVSRMTSRTASASVGATYRKSAFRSPTTVSQMRICVA